MRCCEHVACRLLIQMATELMCAMLLLPLLYDIPLLAFHVFLFSYVRLLLPLFRPSLVKHFIPPIPSSIAQDVVLDAFCSVRRGYLRLLIFLLLLLLHKPFCCCAEFLEYVARLPPDPFCESPLRMSLSFSKAQSSDLGARACAANEFYIYE